MARVIYPWKFTVANIQIRNKVSVYNDKILDHGHRKEIVFSRMNIGKLSLLTYVFYIFNQLFLSKHF